MPEGVTGAGARLSAEEVSRYHEDGIVIPDYRVPDELLQRMRAALGRLEAANPHITLDNIVCPHLPHAGVQGIEGDPEWLEFARHPDLLNMVEQLIGPDFLLWGTTVFGKPPHSGKETPWHQDGEYWPIRPLATCSAWIALDDATPENGCLRVIPGSHREQRIRAHHTEDGDHLTLNQALDTGEYREEDAMDVVLEAGQLSLHDVYLVHGSKPNRSSKRRAGFVCRFMPTTSHFDHALGAEIQRRSKVVDFANRRVILMRGRDACGLNDFTVGT